MVDMHATSNQQTGRPAAPLAKKCLVQRGVRERGEILKSTDGRTDMRMANGRAAAFASIKWLHHDYTAASSCGGPFDGRLINDLRVPVPKMFAARKKGALMILMIEIIACFPNTPGIIFLKETFAE